MEKLVEQINRDGDVARAALERQPLAALAADPFLLPSGSVDGR